MHQGSCLCGAVKFELLRDPPLVSHCHCSMCRKAHGAAFATYVTIEKADVRFVSGADNLTSYNSSGTIQRKFCGTCGSNVEWSGHPGYAEWTAIPLGLFDTPFRPAKIDQVFTESKVPWCNLA
jgi:hypothetical protein